MRTIPKKSNHYHKGGLAGKYYLTCNQEQFQDTEVLDKTEIRAIVKGLISDNHVRKNRHIILKVGNRSILEKEYNIGEKLKGIPGFIKFICLYSCPDSLSRYTKAHRVRLCEPGIENDSLHMLVMPYMKIGSIEDFDWMANAALLSSCIQQVFLSLLYAFDDYGFVHSDIHLDNILLNTTQKVTIDYRDTSVITHGMKVCIMDFDKSFISVPRENSFALFQDIERILLELRLACKLTFEPLQEMITYAHQRSAFGSTPNTKDILELVKMAVSITAIQKQDLMRSSLVYDPNVF